jgi:hypothetical protein
VAEPRRFRRYPHTCLASVATGRGEVCGGYLVDVSWGGLAVRLPRDADRDGAAPVVEQERVRLRIVDPGRGVFHVSGPVRWIRLTALQVRLGLELHRADPAFYGLVLASARGE